MRNHGKLLVSGLLATWVLTATRVEAVDPGSTDARAIMRAALDPKSGERTAARMRMTIRQGTATRERVMTVRAKRSQEGRKSLILIEQPADVRNTGFLTVDYKARDRSDEQWLYLPALHRVSRVPRSGKSDAFVGSDFSISDLAGQDPEDYEFKLIEHSAKAGDEECWVVEGVPRSEAVKNETGYVKLQSWISKSKQIPIQHKAWTVSDGKTKYFKASDIRLEAGVWTPHRLQMRTLQKGVVASETVIDVLSVDNDAADVTEADFTQQRLERGV
jgi:hypothetical protein